MSKKTKLCPFRKVVERESDGMTGKVVERERFQPCIGHKCMAYAYIAPVINIPDDGNPCNWGCAQLLKGDAGDGIG